MHIEHIAIWTADLERLKAFYETYFQAAAGPRYTNPQRGFQSCFLTFSCGARLELMSMSTISPSCSDPQTQSSGLTHLAVATGSEEAVGTLTARLRADGYPVLNGPRRTGDGYYESVVLDPDGNRIEITTSALRPARQHSEARAMPIQTARLCLVPATMELVRAEMEDAPALANLLGADVPADWPSEAVREILPDLVQQLTDPNLVGWLIWYWLSRVERVGRTCLVGSGGFKGPPVAGQVEIGYGAAPFYQGHGYATEAVAALVGWAWSQPGVQRVVAEVLPDNAASVRVLEKCAFRRVGPGLEAGTVQFAIETGLC